MEKINIKSRRYLGSKAKLLNFIKNVVNTECTDCKSFLDLFAGTGNVASIFNTKDVSVILNDILKCNYFSYNSFFGNEKYDKDKIESLINYYNSLSIQEDNYFSINFSNTYFSDENCKKIGHIREDIEKKYVNNIINFREKSILITSLIYSMDRIANTVGHYDAYRMSGDLSKPLIMNNLDIPEDDINMNNFIFNEDANALVNKIKADIVYIDPPYNSRQYCDAYHLLENVARWEKPDVFGTAKKMDRTALKSKYCTKSAPLQFEELISKIEGKYILVSYNNMGQKGAGRSQAKITDDDILRILNAKGSVKVFETDFNQFTTGKTNINNHKERLFLCKIGFPAEEKYKHSFDGIVKSPLNYTGGKTKIMSQILSKFPNDIDVFVDLFGGGFNVGANVIANKIVYNDKQKQVCRVIKLFNAYSYDYIIKKIEKIIDEYGLSNTCIYGYEKYGCNSDSGVGPFNKEKYYKLREKYNSLKKESVEKDFILLTLIIYSFNNQIRFNSKGQFNMPVGKRDLNMSTRKNIKEFGTNLFNKDIQFFNKDFEKVNIDFNSLVYCDPPYFLGTASYNENDGWNIEDEQRLLTFLIELDKKGIRFALSNVIEHKGKEHTLLKEWVDNNHFNTIYIKSSYNNANYQIKNKNSITREVLITNY